MKKYRKKPVVIEARGPLTESEMVTTAHGRVRAEAGDYILVDPKMGDTWPIKPDIFEATYQDVDYSPESCEAQVDRLSKVILEHCPEEIGKGDPAHGEGAVDVAIRLLKKRFKKNEVREGAPKEPEEVDPNAALIEGDENEPEE